MSVHLDESTEHSLTSGVGDKPTGTGSECQIFRIEVYSVTAVATPTQFP